MSVLATHAAWVLVVTFAISLLYELWRATTKAGTSRHDSPKAFAKQLVLYLVAGGVIAALFTGLLFAAATLLLYDVQGWTLQT
jgi:uncharacterized membrane protein